MSYMCRDCSTTDSDKDIMRTIDPIKFARGEKVRVSLCYDCWAERYETGIWSNISDEYTI